MKKSNKITKTAIIAATRTRKGNGFNPAYSFDCDLNSHNFERPMGRDFCVVTRIVDNEPVTDSFLANSKNEFINGVYEFLNK